MSAVNTRHTQIHDRVLELIRDYLLEHRGASYDELPAHTRFREDLDLDSIDLAAMAGEWESEYGITIEDERVVTVETVGDAVGLVLTLSTTA
jgi:acyl carrier protein